MVHAHNGLEVPKLTLRKRFKSTTYNALIVEKMKRGLSVYRSNEESQDSQFVLPDVIWLPS